MLTGRCPPTARASRTGRCARSSRRPGRARARRARGRRSGSRPRGRASGGGRRASRTGRPGRTRAGRSCAWSARSRARSRSSSSSTTPTWPSRRCSTCWLDVAAACTTRRCSWSGSRGRISWSAGPRGAAPERRRARRSARSRPRRACRCWSASPAAASSTPHSVGSPRRRAATRSSSSSSWPTSTSSAPADALPPALHALLAARLDRLDAAERSALALGAVAGDAFEPAIVHALAAGITRAEIEQACDRLVERDLLVRPARTPRRCASATRWSARPPTRRWPSPRGRGCTSATRPGSTGSATSCRRPTRASALHLETAWRYEQEIGAGGAGRARGAAGAGCAAAAAWVARGRGDLLGRDRLPRPRRRAAGHRVRAGRRAAAELVSALAEAGASTARRRSPSARSHERVARPRARRGAVGDRARAHPALVPPRQLRRRRPRRGRRGRLGDAGRAGDELGLARAAYLMSDLAWLMGDPVASYAHAERMLDHARRAGSGFDVATALVFMAWGLVEGPWPAPEAIARCDALARRRRPARRRAEPARLPGGADGDDRPLRRGARRHGRGPCRARRAAAGRDRRLPGAARRARRDAGGRSGGGRARRPRRRGDRLRSPATAGTRRWSTSTSRTPCSPRSGPPDAAEAVAQIETMRGALRPRVDDQAPHRPGARRGRRRASPSAGWRTRSGGRAGRDDAAGPLPRRRAARRSPSCCWRPGATRRRGRGPARARARRGKGNLVAAAATRQRFAALLGSPCRRPRR